MMTEWNEKRINKITSMLTEFNPFSEADKNYACIVSELEDFVNPFGFPKKELVEAICNVSKVKKNFMILAIACMYIHGYTYECEERRSGCWDERSKASKLYCYSQKLALMDAFKNISGREIKMSSEPKHQYALADCFIDTMLPKLKVTELRKELECFQRTHSTLQQSMMGIFANVMHQEFPEQFNDAWFPFI